MSATADNATTRKQYPFDTIEAEQQRLWHEKKAFRVPNPGEDGFDPAKPKFYVLDMFPYPSGAGLHVGHAEGYTATDIISRYKRMHGFNVLHPMGWDAFGLPAEQYAIKTGQHPRVTTQQNVARFREQLDSIGFSYDWSREIDTTDPGYFKWTQWIFRLIYESWFDPEKNQARPISELEEKRKAEKPEESDEERRAFLDSKRLAFVSHQPVNWSPDLGTVLANEEVEEWTAKGHKVERRPLRQWMLRITDFAQRLIDDLELVDWPDHVKKRQRDWIGRSEGAFVDFEVWPLDTQAGHGNEELVQNTIRVFTTRPDTLFGATYMVLAPEHPLVEQITTAEQKEAVTKYQQEIANKSDLERTELAKDKTGVFTGAFAKNPVNDESIPIWIADYVLMGYGTGAIMAVPAHDERDFEFAQKYQLPIKQVVAPSEWEFARGDDVSSSREFPYFDGDIEEVSVHSGRNLPHWEKNGAIYAVTFRLKDSVPQEKIEEWRRQAQRLEEQAAKGKIRISATKRFRVESLQKYLDRNASPKLENGEMKQVVEDSLKHFDKERYNLFAWCVMPNHVHAVLQPLGENKLSTIIQGWKSFSARKINTLRGLEEGSVWESDYFNRIIRDEGELYHQVAYVLNNPLMAGLKNWEYVGINQQELPLRVVEADDTRRRDVVATGGDPTTAPGIAINSPLIDGLPTDRAKKTITNWLEQNGKGQGAVNYKLRDWLFSRQRYWGEPFPIVWDEKTGHHFSVAEDELPVTLPEMEDFKPSGTTDPPLSKAKDWVRYSETARRETNTMPQWAGSCWYYLRFCDPNCQTAPISKEAEQYWMKNGVDLYIGGVEHAVLHLLYARFWHKVLYDYGVVSEPEPFQRLVNPGIILGADNQKMSKSLGNVVNPEDVMELYGADSLRLFEMFIGPLTQSAPWSMSGVEGVHRFLARTWRLFMQENQEGQWEPSPAVNHSAEATEDQLKVLHQTIRKVTDDLEALSFNTAISQMMVFVNELTRCETRPWSVLEPFLRLLSPFAPHLAGHLWSTLRQESDGALLMHQAWPEADEKYLVEDEVTLVLQVNGKVRDKVTVTADEAQDKAHMEEIARSNEKVLKFAEEGEIRKVIVVPGKLVNVVVK